MKRPYNHPVSDSHIEKEWIEKYYSHTHPMAFVKNKHGRDLYIISFNNPMLVEYQLKLWPLLSSNWEIFIIDNNCGLHPENSAKVAALCTQYGAHYVEAPDNHFQKPQFFDTSMKVGNTMNWVYHNITKRREPAFFGFLDHDCFPFRHIGIGPLQIYEKGMYGLVSHSHSTPAWNLHIICNFFKFDFVRDIPLDFRPSHMHQLDTGGANYNHLYRHHKKEDYMLSHRGVRYTDDDICRKDAVQHYEIIDECWFHIAATTHDQLVGDGEKKLLYAKGFLDAVIELYTPKR